MVSNYTRHDTKSARTSKVEPPSESAPTSRHGTLEVSFVPPSTSAGDLCGGSGDLLLFDLENRRETRHAIASRRIMVSARAGHGCVLTRSGLAHAHALCVIVEFCSVWREEEIRGRLWAAFAL
jgi:hypothetical protein